MDPNLLPQDFRSREDKEQARQKKRPAGVDFELNLTSPINSGTKPKAKTHKNRGSFWSGIFGSKPRARTANEIRLTDPKMEKTPWQSFDLLDAGKSPRMKKNVKGGEPGFFGRMLGKPVSPLAGEERNARKAPDSVHSAAKPLPQKRNASRQGDSWPEILKNMFGSGRRKRVDFRMASQQPAPLQPQKHQAAPDTAQAEKKPATDNRPRLPEAAPERKNHSKGAQTSAYHIVPKRERASEFNVNLMPQDILSGREFGASHGLKSVIIAVLLPVIIITVGFIAILLLERDSQARMAVRQQEFQDLERQIGNFVLREKQNNAVADRVSLIKKIMDNRIIWNNFFDKLEKYTLDGVYYTNLTADSSGVMTLPGVADNYETLARQMAALDKADDFIKDAKLSNAQLISQGKSGIIGVGFQVRLTLQDDVLKNPSIK